MTTKSPSRKHVIISISNDNNAKFIKNSFTYITNINRALRNMKFEILVNFIHSDLFYRSLNNMSRIQTISTPFKLKFLVYYLNRYLGYSK